MPRNYNVPDPFMPVYLRKNKSGVGTLKGLPFKQFKAKKPNSNFFDDLVVIRENLLKASQFFYGCASQAQIRDPAIASVHACTLDKKALVISENLKMEGNAIPNVWRFFVGEEWQMPDSISDCYTIAQLEYRPDLSRAGVDPRHVSFMSKEDKDELLLFQAIAAQTFAVGAQMPDGLVEAEQEFDPILLDQEFEG